MRPARVLVALFVVSAALVCKVSPVMDSALPGAVLEYSPDGASAVQPHQPFPAHFVFAGDVVRNGMVVATGEGRANETQPSSSQRAPGKRRVKNPRAAAEAAGEAVAAAEMERKRKLPPPPSKRARGRAASAAKRLKGGDGPQQGEMIALPAGDTAAPGAAGPAASAGLQLALTSTAPGGGTMVLTGPGADLSAEADKAYLVRLIAVLFLELLIYFKYFFLLHVVINKNIYIMIVCCSQDELMSSGRNGTAQQYRPHVLKYKRLISGNLTLAQDSAEEKAIVSAPEFGAAAPSQILCYSMG